MMNLPFVSRARFEAAQQKIAALEDKIALLLDAKAKAEELIAAEKELRKEAESKAAESFDSTTKRDRMFGKDLRDRATAWATERSIKQGTTK